ncbi:MAG: type IV pilin protein [Bdellovibrionales bacterium]
MVVGIIGILAAVGIPAYQKYQSRAELGVVQSTVNQVRKAYQTCMSVNDYATCTIKDVDGTISVEGDLTLAAANTIPATEKTCWLVSKTGFTGCVGFTGRKFDGLAFGAPLGISCSSLKPTGCSGAATQGCPAGCTPAACSSTTLPANCGAGTTTAATTAGCSNGECS